MRMKISNQDSMHDTSETKRQEREERNSRHSRVVHQGKDPSSHPQGGEDRAKDTAPSLASNPHALVSARQLCLTNVRLDGRTLPAKHLREIVRVGLDRTIDVGLRHALQHDDPIVRLGPTSHEGVLANIHLLALPIVAGISVNEVRVLLLYHFVSK